MSLNETLSRIQETISQYICPIFLTFGLIGCFLNILLFSQKEFRRISCCLYFLVSSFAMLIALIVGFVPHIYSVNHPNPANTILIICKIRSYIGQSLTMIYRWLMTMACIDRYIISSTNFPLRKYTNPRVARSIIITIVIICLVLPIHNLIFLKTKRGWCVPSTTFFVIYHSLFTFIFGGFFPTLIMIISVIRIRSNLASKQARRCKNVSPGKENQRNRLISERDDQIIVMLYLQILFYITLNIPWMIYLLYTPYIYTQRNLTIDRITIERFAQYSTEIIVYMYPTLSFYIYTLTSKRFRTKLFHLIYLIFTCKHRSKNNSYLTQNQFEIPCTERSDQSTEKKIFGESSQKQEENSSLTPVLLHQQQSTNDQI